ncbi:MAG: hypothetical protein CVV04_12955 [Firmicutes bacterium HGW-Firmicutes-9]|nr:MAG: hypothetical protein CVV04_12955 [Firmicutes bacterium HGW-Firmicutes-9]
MIMFLQRACGAESQAENKSSNGPLRVQSKGLARVFCNVKAYVSCQGYGSILSSVRSYRKSRWHRG